MLYVGSPHMRVTGLESPQAGKALLNMLLLHATSPAFTYFHAWDKGDIIIWDNTQVRCLGLPSPKPLVAPRWHRSPETFPLSRKHTRHCITPCLVSATKPVVQGGSRVLHLISSLLVIVSQTRTMELPFANFTAPRLVYVWRKSLTTLNNARPRENFCSSCS